MKLKNISTEIAQFSQAAPPWKRTTVILTNRKQHSVNGESYSTKNPLPATASFSIYLWYHCQNGVGFSVFVQTNLREIWQLLIQVLLKIVTHNIKENNHCPYPPYIYISWNNEN